MGAGCDDKASAYEYTLPAARAPLGDIVDLLGGEEMIKYTQGMARPQLEMFFAFLSNTGYAQNVRYYGVIEMKPETLFARGQKSMGLMKPKLPWYTSW